MQRKPPGPFDISYFFRAQFIIHIADNGIPYLNEIQVMQLDLNN